jgi:hypothetical protein
LREGKRQKDSKKKRERERGKVGRKKKVKCREKRNKKMRLIKNDGESKNQSKNLFLKIIRQKSQFR